MTTDPTSVQQVFNTRVQQPLLTPVLNVRVEHVRTNERTYLETVVESDGAITKRYARDSQNGIEFIHQNRKPNTPGHTMTEHITAIEAAELLGVSLNQIRQLTFQRKLVVTAKRGRLVLYDLDTIKAYHPNKHEGDTTCPPATTSEPQPNESAATQAVGLYDYSSTI
jgi:hypothetical protein